MLRALGDAGAGYREACDRYPIDERPVVRSCRERRDVMDALLGETWTRRGLLGTPRATPDVGIRVYPPGFEPARQRTSRANPHAFIGADEPVHHRR